MHILFSVDSMERHFFFRRLASALHDSHRISFFTTEPLSALLAKSYGYAVVALLDAAETSHVYTREELHDAAISSIELINGGFSGKAAINDMHRLCNSVHNYITENKVDQIVVWNGQQLLGRATTLVAKKLQIKIKYLELSNLPGKLFCDPEGVNALSSIARNPAILDKLPEVSDEVHKEWIANYEESKQGLLPQAIKRRRMLALSAINYLLKKLISSPCVEGLEAKIKRAFNPAVETAVLDIASDRAYIFLPLQTSSDTQIKLHSKINNIQAVQIAHEIALKANLGLVVKLHPAERNRQEILEVLDMQKRLKFNISNRNTTDLIKKSHSIITINSTVGLEGLIYGKNVTVLGNSLYRDFNSDRLKKYIHGFLVDGIDYFSNKQISKAVALSVMAC